jgi:6-phosphogluconolactonase (cycloisomerase 2 family)
MRRRRILVPIMAALLVASLPMSTTVIAGAPQEHGSAVYTISNDPAGNAVVRFDRLADGQLANPTSFPTGGTGTGASLGSQGAVVLSPSGRWLAAVDAGSDSVALFRVRANGIHRTDRVGSRGDMPVSVTIRRGLLFVVNAGGTNIAGFRIDRWGDLHRVAGSNRPLSAVGAAPAQIELTRDGRKLVVTEKMTNVISVYRVGAHGRARGPVVSPSSGTTPFGFAIDRAGHLVVSEAFGGAPDVSATSSYRIMAGGQLAVLSPSVGTTQTAACWVAIAGRFAFVTNTGSGSVSSYRIQGDGEITLRRAVAGSTGMGSGPIDMASAAGRFLYVVAGASDQIVAFRIRSDGDLDAIGSIPIGPSAQGLAAG